MNIPKNVIVKKGNLIGPTLAIFCGVHGNEKAGIMAVNRILQDIKITTGTVYFVYANPIAIEKNIRFVNINLNRLFFRQKIISDFYEYARAKELMDLLDTCDGLLDLHSYRAPHMRENAIPFAICEERDIELAKKCSVQYIVNGFSDIEKGGSDGYMYSQNKVGICIELGALECPESFVELGMLTIQIFLQSFGCISLQRENRSTSVEPKTLQLKSMYKKTHADFHFIRHFHSFEPIRANEIIAKENGHIIRAKNDCIILFPHADGPLGIEVYMLAEAI